MHTFRAHNALIIGMAVLLAALLLATAGCSGTLSTQTTQVRFINAVPNGGTATFQSGGAFYANEPFFAQSSYEAVGTGTTSFSFFLSANPANTFTSSTTALVANAPYSAIAMGRQDVASTDTRSPQIQVVQDDQTAPPTGDITLRIINAAPDLTGVNVIVNTTIEASNISYPSIGPFITIPNATLTISVVQSGVGGATEVSPIQFTGITAGHHYTAFVIEPTVTPTYTVDLIDDTTNTLMT